MHTHTIKESFVEVSRVPKNIGKFSHQDRYRKAATAAVDVINISKQVTERALFKPYTNRNV